MFVDGYFINPTRGNVFFFVIMRCDLNILHVFSPVAVIILDLSILF